MVCLLPSIDAQGNPEEGARMMELPGVYLDAQELYMQMGRGEDGQVLSFSPDGSLLSCARPRSIDIYAVESASHLMRIDWPRLVQMLGASIDSTVPKRDLDDLDDHEWAASDFGTFKDPQRRADDLDNSFFAGAAFSPDGSELRVNAGWDATGIAMFRIFDHGLRAAE